MLEPDVLKGTSPVLRGERLREEPTYPTPVKVTITTLAAVSKGFALMSLATFLTS
jgi:hypothetical protein